MLARRLRAGGRYLTCAPPPGRRQAAALGMAILKTIGLAGGIIGPWALGYLKEQSGTFIEPMYASALTNVVAAVAFFGLRFCDDSASS